ncbi:MAG: autotransporter domain-containing protein [Candidatus Ochrobactrum gambitense]|nr:MAG: autotransporter domain-containing protein [Candidatus Ochrobactrum gambitense]WEK17247.1 MAG: autotransporter domain-containing protein [Candidatus Ochrobactrum gambitense]
MTYIFNRKTNSLLAAITSIISLFSTTAYSQSITDNDEMTYFNRAIIFGDSLSDNGTFNNWIVKKIERRITTDGRFSNGWVWNEYLFPNQKRGTAFMILRLRNGDFGSNTPNGDANVNYAIGGTKYQDAGFTESLIVPSIADEVEEFIHGNNSISPHTLVPLWAGGNDAMDALDDGVSTRVKAEFSGNELSGALERLYRAGARQFLVPDLPDFSKVPRYANSHGIPSKAATEDFNNAIADSIAAFRKKHPDAVVYAPKVANILDMVIKYPGIFGFTNATGNCVGTPSCLNQPRGSALQNEYVFWDDIHPTTRTHNYIANYMREYWSNPELAGFYVRSPDGLFKTERNIFFPTSDKIVSGYLDGDRSLYKMQSGKLTLTGENKYTGNSFVLEGGLELGNGGKTGSIIGDVDLMQKDAFLSFNRSNLLNFDGKITGDGRVQQVGQGITILGGQNSYKGTTDIYAGELMVNGSITSPVLVHSGGTLSGTGFTGGITAGNGAHVAPGDFRTSGTKTLKANGDIDLKEGSTLDIGVGTDGSTSLLYGSNRAQLAGGVVFDGDRKRVPLTVDEIIARLGKSSVFLKADNGITGRFNMVSPTYNFIGEELDYKKNEVGVTFVKQEKRFSVYAANNQQRNVADALQALGQHNKLYKNVFTSRVEDNVSEAYTQLSGDIYASTLTSLLYDNQLPREAVMQRMNGLSVRRFTHSANALDAPLKNGVWGQAYNSTAHFQSDGEAQGMSRSATGFITGIDGEVSDDWQLGMFAGYMQSSLNSGLSSAKIDSFQVGAYGGYAWQNFNLTFGGNANLHDIDSRRTIRFSEIANDNRASYKASSFQGFAELGYNIGTRLVLLEPFAGISYAYAKTNGFTENAAVTALSGSGATSSLLSNYLGIRLSNNYAISENTSVNTRLALGWQHNSYTQPETMLSFGNESGFVVAGLPLDRNLFYAQAGLDFNLTHNTSLGLHYRGQFANKAQDHAFKVNLAVNF